MPEQRRYPILVAFLYQTLVDLTDDAVDLFDHCLADAYHRARRDLEDFRISVAEATNEKVRLFREICRGILDPKVRDVDLQRAIYRRWYVRDETLKAATTQFVNFQFRQPLSRFWGTGTLSSSDGQRFPVSGKVRMATALPRYFGYGKGVTFYTWTSDQFSQYGTKVIPTTVRDATYVLDEILDNETELPILEHTTDTAGYTEIVFALFDLLGLQFSPRIRDLGDQRLSPVTVKIVVFFSVAIGTPTWFLEEIVRPSLRPIMMGPSAPQHPQILSELPVTPIIQPTCCNCR
jgi:hypothetical protein